MKALRKADNTPVQGVVERIVAQTKIETGLRIYEEQLAPSVTILPPIVGEIDENQVALNEQLERRIGRIRKTRKSHEFPTDYELGIASYGDNVIVAWLRDSIGQWFSSPLFPEVVRVIEEAILDLYPRANIIHCDNNTKAIYQINVPALDDGSQERVEKMISTAGSLVPNYRRTFFPGEENERAYETAYSTLHTSGRIVVLTGNKQWAQILARQVAQEASTLFDKKEVKCFHMDAAYDEWQARWEKARNGEFEKGRIETAYAKRLVAIGTFDFWKNRKGSAASADVTAKIIDRACRSGSVLIVLDGDYDPEYFPEPIVKALGQAEFVEVLPPSEETIRDAVYSANSSLPAAQRLPDKDVEGKILRIVSGMPNALFNALNILESRTGASLQLLAHPSTQGIEHTATVVARSYQTTARLLRYKKPGSREDRLEFCMAIFLASELPNVSTDELAEYFKRKPFQINRIIADMKKAIDWNPNVEERIGFLRKRIRIEPL